MWIWIVATACLTALIVAVVMASLCVASIADEGAERWQYEHPTEEWMRELIDAMMQGSDVPRDAGMRLMAAYQAQRRDYEHRASAMMARYGE